MKARTLFSNIFFLSVCLWSCKPEHVKVYERLEGTWQLESLSYTNTNRKPVVIFNEQYQITFTDKGHKGILSIDGKKYSFSYNFGDGMCNLAFQNQIGLPADAIGKVNMYSFSFNGKKKIRFSTEQEYNYVDKELFYDVEYAFTRL